jgi:hypothetical protein
MVVSMRDVVYGVYSAAVTTLAVTRTSPTGSATTANADCIGVRYERHWYNCIFERE